ncbi:MAG TPA: hypothetical protein VEC99_02540 [Clostridia bacterium]|nr:hypothetical protein [Clostridia bacterium]
MKKAATIIVSGMIATDPFQGGATWAVLQYVLGLRALGYRVYFVEPVPEKALRPPGSSLESSENAAYFHQVMEEFNLLDSSALLLAGTRETVGLSYEQLQGVARRTEVLLNISGMLQDETLTGAIPVRVYLDLDPGFNQLWSVVQGIDMRFAGHTHFVTIGLAIGEPSCPVPACGYSWLKTLQPVVLEYWPQTEPIFNGALTTIGNWRAYGSIEHQGVLYGQKAHSLRPLFRLPQVTGEEFKLAMAIHPGETSDLAALAGGGWNLVNPAEVADTPANYQQFIRSSKAEFGIAKSGYVAAQCGWFSDRSVCYLASGRPVLAQDTGFSPYLPTGEGLFAFRTIEDVAQAIAALRADYPKHVRRARAIAENFFDSNKVLPRLLEQVGI